MPRRRKRLRFKRRFPFVSFGGLGEVTKKDFIALANAFCRHGASEALVGDVTNYFASQNPRFDRGRFVAATKKC